MDTDRRQFLLKVYDQMFNDINRHILVVWQSLGVVIGAFAIFALVEKNVMPLDYAAALIMLLSWWAFAHVIDSSFWYNRNLVIIANIEREFLDQNDTQLIHFYFSAHRKDNKMIGHLKLQSYLAGGIGLIVLVYHFSDRIYPGFDSPLSSLDLQRALPYVVTIISIYVLRRHSEDRRKKYDEFLERSPGKEVVSAAEGSIGHGQD